MANQITINIGAVANDGTGDPLRTAFNDVNLNFASVWNTGLPTSNVQFSDNRLLTVNTNANLVLAPNGIGVVQSNVSMIPSINRVHSLGSQSKKWNTLYAYYVEADIANIASFGNLSIDVANLHISGGSNGYVLQTDGTGNLSWTAQTGGSGNGVPGGANTQVQFNDAGNFGGKAGFIFNKNTDTLQLPGLVIPASNVTQNLGTSTARWNIIYANSVQASNVTAINNIFANNASIGNITSTDVINGRQGSFTGDSYGDNAMYLGYPASTTLGTDVVIQIAGNAASYSQVNFQNVNGNSDASGDYIITADNGNDETHFIDIGMTSSTWDGSQPNSLEGLAPNNGYLYVQDGNLTLGTKNDTTSNTWRLDTNGVLTLPQGAKILDTNDWYIGIGKDVGPGASAAVSIGYAAGNAGQSFQSVAIGAYAGANAQSGIAVAIGAYAGANTQGQDGVAIGDNAAANTQGQYAVAVGSYAGNDSQGDFGIAIGYGAGSTNQGDNSVAIGEYAGGTNQGNNAIAIGNYAGSDGQPDNSIMLNADANSMGGTNSGFYVNPVRHDTGNVTNAVYYNTFTKELTYGAGGSGTANMIYNGNSNVSIPGADGDVYINANASSNQQWQFGVDGTLTVPLGSQIKALPDSYVGLTSGNGHVFSYVNNEGFFVNTQYGFGDQHTWQFDNEGKIVLNNTQALWPFDANGITLTANIQQDINGFSTEYLGDAAVYANSNVQIVTDSANSELTWTFDNTGNLTTPDGNIIVHASHGNIVVGDSTASSSPGVSSDISFTLTAGRGDTDESWVFDSTGNLTTPEGAGDITMSGGNIANVGNIIMTDGGFITEGTSPTGTGNSVVITPANGSNPNQQLTIYPTVVEGNHLHLTSGDLSVTDIFLGNDTQYIRTGNLGNMVIGTAGGEVFGGYAWTFNTLGETVFPILTTARGDNTYSTLTGQTLRMGDGSTQAIITTPDGGAGGSADSQRLIINPGKGQDGTSGEGGDIYLWAGRGAINEGPGGSGGDIKIRGGQGMSGGDGGYIRMEAGDSNNDNGAAGYILITGGVTNGGNPGYVNITGGYNNGGDGGNANITGGHGSSIGGNVFITGGSGGSNGGNVNIIGGGGSNVGNINLYSPTYLPPLQTNIDSGEQVVLNGARTIIPGLNSPTWVYAAHVTSAETETMVWTASSRYVNSARLTMTVESGGGGSYPNWEQFDIAVVKQYDGSGAYVTVSNKVAANASIALTTVTANVDEAFQLNVSLTLPAGRPDAKVNYTATEFNASAD